MKPIYDYDDRCKPLSYQRIGWYFLKPDKTITSQQCKHQTPPFTAIFPIPCDKPIHHKRCGKCQIKQRINGYPALPVKFLNRNLLTVLLSQQKAGKNKKHCRTNTSPATTGISVKYSCAAYCAAEMECKNHQNGCCPYEIQPAIPSHIVRYLNLPKSERNLIHHNNV